MYKIIVGDEYIRSDKLGIATPTVISLDSDRFVKTAGIDDIISFARNIPKDSSKTRLLVIAMGAGDFYGANKNGDYFAEDELIPSHNTFEDAKFFRHHLNKDPSKAYGDVLKSFYNDRMHRVELIIDIINSKAPDTVAKIKAGIPIAVSMGCKVKYDICSICGNKAPSRAYYCDHAKFRMGDILPDGRSVYVYNPNPRFFDISEVFKPADQMGWSIKKVAGQNRLQLSADLGSFAEEIDEKRSTLQKTNDILKRLRGVGVGLDELDTKALNYLPHTQIKKVSFLDAPRLRLIIKVPLSTALSTCNNLGMPLTTRELSQLIMPRLEGDYSPNDMCHASQTVDDIMTNRPDILISVKRIMLSSPSDSELAQELKPVAETRALAPDNIKDLLIGEKPKVKLKPDKVDSTTAQDLKGSEEEKVGMALLTMSANRFLPSIFTKKSEQISRLCAHIIDHNAMQSQTRMFPILKKVSEAIVKDGYIESDKYAVDKITQYSNLIGKAFLHDLKLS